MRKRQLKVTEAQSGAALSAFVREALFVSAEEAKALVEQGAVYRQGKRCRVPNTPLSAGDSITVVLEESGQDALLRAPTTGAPRVLFEDDDVLALDKPAGVAAQPTPSGREKTLLDYASDHLGHPAGLVHRLDRETSGVTVFGKRQGATSALAQAFREGTARKRYLAVCSPAVESSGTIDLPLSPDPSRPGRYRASKEANGVPALTRYQRLAQGEGFALVALYPQTGRTHQLRAHLTALHAPILGDRRYGGASTAAGLPASRCLLHAQTLVLPHPSASRTLTLHAELPPDLRAFFERVGCGEPTGEW